MIKPLRVHSCLYCSNFWNRGSAGCWVGALWSLEYVLSNLFPALWPNVQVMRYYFIWCLFAWRSLCLGSFRVLSVSLDSHLFVDSTLSQRHVNSSSGACTCATQRVANAEEPWGHTSSGTFRRFIPHIMLYLLSGDETHSKHWSETLQHMSPGLQYLVATTILTLRTFAKRS